MTQKRILGWILALGVLASVFVSVHRTLALSGDRSVAVALWLRAARYTGVTYGEPVDQILKAYKDAGITTLMVSGTTLQTMMDLGATAYSGPHPVLVSVDSGGDLLARSNATPLPYRPQAGYAYVTVRDNPGLAQWLMDRLQARLGADSLRRLDPAPGVTVLQVRGMEPAQLSVLNLGVHPADIQVAEQLGLRVAVHYSEPVPAPRPVRPDALLEHLPRGTSILWTGAGGLPAGLLPLMEQGQHKLLLDHSKPPFSEGLVPQAEDAARTLGYRAIKVFRVTYSHSLADVLAAVKERNMGMVLVQPFHLSDRLKEDLEAQSATWRHLAHDLTASGIKLGEPSLLTPYAPPAWAMTLAGMALGAAAATLLPGLPLLVGWLMVLTGGAVALAASVERLPAMLPSTIVLQMLALAAAIAGPALGALRGISAPTPRRRIAWLIGAAFGTAALIGTLLGDIRFVLELALFRGIKIALVGPSVLFLAAMAWSRRHALLRLVSEPLRTWHVGAVLIGTIAVAVMLVRSGQDSEILLVTGLELKLRQMLDQVLLVRPRFKEFLVGWPLLLLGDFFLRRGDRPVGVALLAVGMIAPASLINSFAHLHTPMWMSALRGLHGLWIGALFGALLLWVVRRRDERHA